MDYLTQICVQAKEASKTMRRIRTAEKNEILLHAAELLIASKEHLINENKIDMENGRKNHMPAGLLDRLKLDENRIEAMADGLRQIASLKDPIGSMDNVSVRPNGLKIGKQRVPLGVIGIIYEARPNVTTDAFGLCFKSSNVTILRGGSYAGHSNAAITEVLRKALKDFSIDENAVQLLENTDHESLKQFMQMTEYVDLLIPRGGAGLIRSVVANATIPVIETGVGNCHIYVDESADLDMAIRIIFNAKTQRIGVCNACESLVIHEKIVDRLMPSLKKALDEKNVEIHADERALKSLGEENASEKALGEKHLKAATTEDWAKEYLDYVISAKTVKSLEEAIDHINRYNTGHSEAIITNDLDHALRFTSEIDAACVYVNASTRFTDGNEFGFGAEVGISTQKLHARGPMGLEALTTYKYVILGNGQIRE